ncbi:MAG: NYN domain-containing protein [Deltaproteobacteria bacterium RIFCSPLOWO2_12_FULL_44_12]|nr:MAG: NYN domain-containing protein [Deltaproteobacteria bacterium RIFCSPHIGHO2_01_FULL_43_49]OGQ15566.1 MAG: NYN domain-containing protein [Deltaproteobacteria bacterium RIFCSPHIGHO2_02_FULL_44_53]OGQ28508.1 MAG: NYN domain-containing protein [Deltaproteobacteria bacterium RIFCSPHIGHO2_12_FULL_44_21]OGQ32372.1 MAG: NYN domain-containing protein [Deltaproteobacteria bacterium RIFCSPLOWO2_01_FULL_45_74]OGQ44014.1 MAG: NYN domain-containing protein [Deltaproteobacteria bacterium RIFCSPLOWO2_02_
MPNEPVTKRTVAFIDGQNLFYSVKKAFGYKFPNYDVEKLAKKVCLEKGWQLDSIRFYTGMPDASADPFWHHFWTAKLAIMGTRGIYSFSRPLRYRHQTTLLPDGTSTAILVGQEKGVDVRIALGVVRLELDNIYDVALIFSQDQDLSEVSDEVKKISTVQHRWIKVASVFPISPTAENRRGINNTEWIKIDRAMYDTCLDKMDYRPKSI